MLGLASAQPEVTVVSDQVGCPTFTANLADGLAELIEGEDYGIHHLAAGGHCSWFEFAQEIFDVADLETDVLAVTTEMIGSVAPRPPFSVLRSERPDPITLPHWRTGLVEYFRRRDALNGLADRSEVLR
jgi:dTDP-4-dehydrorhamnose reductase